VEVFDPASTRVCNKKFVGTRLFEDVEEEEGDITKTNLKEMGCKDVN
jgi:hypothetical protein